MKPGGTGDQAPKPASFSISIEQEREKVKQNGKFLFFWALDRSDCYYAADLV